MRYAQFVIGPAGSGKSTYCAAMVEHATTLRRTIEVVNLDPAAEHFIYEPLIDIRELIQVQDTMEDEDLHFGPNGGLVYCMEYLAENLEWLRDRLGNGDNDYILFDCPGQIELYTHMTAMKKLVSKMEDWDFSICAVYLLDVNFMSDGGKFLSGALAAQTVMINLELPFLTLLSKMDLISKSARKRLDRFLDPDAHAILGDLELTASSAFNNKYRKLSKAIGELLEASSLVKLVPLNLEDPENLTDILTTIDNTVQFGENQDVRTQDFEGDDEDDRKSG